MWRRASQRLPMALDLEFFVAQRKHDISTSVESKAADSRVMSVAMRVKYEALRSECDQRVMRTKELQAAFWSELLLRTPSLQRLDSIGADLHSSIRAAQQSFERLLTLNPSSSASLNRFAEFLSDVSSPPAGSAVLRCRCCRALGLT